MAYLENGLVPIGAILSWAKSLTSVPTLPAGFLECNGQTVSNTSSLLNGVVLPDLNSANNRFLRGNTTSGGSGGSSTHTHSLSSNNSAAAGTDVGYSSPTLATSTLPPYYDVVWVIRIL